MEKVTKYKTAACQIAPFFLDRDATVEKVCGFIGGAASNGTKQVAFPRVIWLGNSGGNGLQFYRL